MPLRAAIFDMDGTLIDSEVVIMQAWLEVARELGCSLSKDQYSAVIGLNSAESDQLLISAVGGHHVYETACEKVERLLRPQSASHVIFPLKPGCMDLLRQLREWRIPCGVASSSSVTEIRDRLARAGVMEYFDAIAGGDEVARGKPDPAVYELAASRLGVSASECLVFEDTEYGARAALAAGAHVVVIPDLVQPSHETLKRAHHVFTTIAAAQALLGEWFRPSSPG